ncbi:MAG: hypothetical protein HQL32_13560 [Planctomycetes bacterium]|nr:hypothetical protein [Planctomycetota bacterium]
MMGQVLIAEQNEEASSPIMGGVLKLSDEPEAKDEVKPEQKEKTRREDRGENRFSSWFKGVFKGDKEPVEAPMVNDDPQPVVSTPAAPEPKEKKAQKESLPGRPALEAIALKKSLMDDAMQVQGRVSYDKGVLLYQQFRYNEALVHFQKAQRLLPKDENVKKYIYRCRQILGLESDSPESVTDWVSETRRMKNEEMSLTITYHFEQARQMMLKADDLWSSNQDGDRSNALQALSNARAEYRSAQDVVSQMDPGSERTKLKRRIAAGLKKIDDKNFVWKAYIQERTEQKARQKAQDLSVQSKEYEKNQYDDLLIRTKRAYLEGNYLKSESMARMILKKWPKSAEAELLLSKSAYRKDEKLFNDIKEKSSVEWRKNIEKLRESSILYSETLTYPSEWEKISKRTAPGQTIQEEPEWLKQMKQKMELRVTLTIPDFTLPEVVEKMQEQTGVSFHIDKNLDLEDARITETFLRDVRLKAALELILNGISAENKLIYQFRDGVVFITSEENQSIFNLPKQKLYDVTDLITSYTSEGAENVGIEGEGSAAMHLDASTEENGVLTVDAIEELIREAASPASWDMTGMSITEFQAGTLLISQIEEVHREIDDLLEMLRKQQTLQVSIEARFISSTDDDLFDIGVEWKGLTELNLEDSGSPTDGTGTYSSRKDNSSDSRVASIMGSAADSIVSDGGSIFVADSRESQGLLAEVAVLNPIRAGLVFHALARKRNIKDLLAPRLSVINNRQAYVIKSTDTSFIKNFRSRNGRLTPVIARASSGELLVVRPTISSDRKYVTMDLSPQITRLIEFELMDLTIPVRNRSGGGRNNNNSSSSSTTYDVTIELPNVEVWQLQTRVQVPDGGVALVGGRMGSQEKTNSYGVPLLSKVPLVGRLFRSDGEYVQLENVIVSVRAKILIFDEYESQLP